VKSKDAFKTIREVSEELKLPQHVLRFWEKKFSHIKPMTRGGGRRYYRPNDIQLLKSIHQLLYMDKYTISGVQNIFRQKGKNYVLNIQSEHNLENNNSVSIKEPEFMSDLFEEVSPHNISKDNFSNQNNLIYREFIEGSIKELRELNTILENSYSS
tara:strand:+ start:29459 stop:29926 length:468 start_codon:yes stop_codon:yes gene_type:complete